MRAHDEAGPSRNSATAASRPSCAECRRLKVRCNRTVPCSSCLRRGCGHICPNGTLVTGQGHRAFWASTQELRQKLSELSARIGALEDALHGFAAHHPLLAEELRRLKDPFLRDAAPGGGGGNRGGAGGAGDGVKEEEEEGVLDAAGSLSVGPDGRTAYIGHEANSWWFMHPSHDDENDAGSPDSPSAAVRRSLPPQIFAATDVFPISLVMPHLAGPMENRLGLLCTYLPSADQAAIIQKHYYDYVASVWNPIPRDEFNELVFAPLYDDTVVFNVTDPVSAHRLAIMFMVLAMGSVSNPSGALQLVNSEKYYRLACASVMGSETAEQPCLEAIQALHLMNLYLYYYSTPSPKSMNVGFLLNGMVVKLAHAIGLHRDPRNFQLSAKEAHRRRMLMCHLYTWDLGAALTLSRPPTLGAPHFDVKPPYTDDPPVDLAYSAWKFSFVTDCLSAVHEEAFGAFPPSYAAITRLDRKTRDYPLPPVLRLPALGPTASPVDYSTRVETPALICQRHYAVIYRERVLLALHRSFFASTLRTHADDPLSAPYGNSIVAACRSASMMIMVAQHLYAQLPHPTSRMWYVWNQVFSAAVILGTLVIHCPTLTFALPAFAHLTTAYDLFSRLPADAAHTPLAVIKKIRERAYLSFQAHGISPSLAPSDLPSAGGYPTSPELGISVAMDEDPPAAAAAATLAAYPLPAYPTQFPPTPAAPTEADPRASLRTLFGGGVPDAAPPPAPVATEADLAALLQYYPTTDANQEALRSVFLQTQTAYTYPEQSSTLFDCNLQDLFEGWQP